VFISLTCNGLIRRQDAMNIHYIFQLMHVLTFCTHVRCRLYLRGCFKTLWCTNTMSYFC